MLAGPQSSPPSTLVLPLSNHEQWPPATMNKQKIYSASSNNAGCPRRSKNKFALAYVIQIFIAYAVFSYHSETFGSVTIVDGTILVADHVLADYIVLGAESRDTQRKAGEVENGGEICKIQRLDDHTVFSASGRFKMYHDIGGLLYDAWATATSAFVPGNDLNDIAERWAMATEAAYYNTYMKGGDIVLRGLSPDSVVTGVFTATDQFDMVTTIVKYKREPSTVRFYHDPPRHIEAGRATVYSDQDGSKLFLEFWQDKSERAHAKQAERQNIINDRQYQNGEAEAFTVKMAIDTALLWNNGIDRQIGGETSVLILSKNKPIKWFHQSTICRQTWSD
jgi:hypothetical protein